MKRKVAILFGGRSVEHEISLRSARNVHEHIDKSVFDIILIGITKSGDWYLQSKVDQNISTTNPLKLKLSAKAPAFIDANNIEMPVDIVFPVLHGTDGEDGSIQGMIKAMGLPIAGSSVLGSAVAMDKIVSKKLLQQSGLPVAGSLYFDNTQRTEYSFEKVVNELGLPFMVKAADQGSSIGVSKVTDQKTYETALDDSFSYSSSVLLEEFIEGRELECGILGNEDPKSTDPGEIILKKDFDFYTYEAKYQDDEAIDIVVPADIPDDVRIKIREVSEKAFLALSCNDFSRVDIFYTKDGRVLVNEINTIPGFTDVSMFPVLWGNMGISYTDLITEIIRLATERWQKETKLNTSYANA
ncbi:MAG: D-alanine--D-alanine ligase [Cyclobacteriaceae bacterium]